MAKENKIPAMYTAFIGKRVHVILREKRFYTGKLVDAIDNTEGVVEEVKWMPKDTQVAHDNRLTLKFLVRFEDGKAYHLPTTDCRPLGD